MSEYLVRFGRSTGADYIFFILLKGKGFDLKGTWF